MASLIADGNPHATATAHMLDGDNSNRRAGPWRISENYPHSNATGASESTCDTKGFRVGSFFLRGKKLDSSGRAIDEQFRPGLDTTRDTYKNRKFIIYINLAANVTRVKVDTYIDALFCKHLAIPVCKHAKIQISLYPGAINREAGELNDLVLRATHRFLECCDLLTHRNIRIEVQPSIGSFAAPPSDPRDMKRIEAMRTLETAFAVKYFWRWLSTMGLDSRCLWVKTFVRTTQVVADRTDVNNNPYTSRIVGKSIFTQPEASMMAEITTISKRWETNNPIGTVSDDNQRIKDMKRFIENHFGITFPQPEPAAVPEPPKQPQPEQAGEQAVVQAAVQGKPRPFGKAARRRANKANKKAGIMGAK